MSKSRSRQLRSCADNLEHYITGAIYPAFLKKLVPIFINCLNGPPVFVSHVCRAGAYYSLSHLRKKSY